VSQLTRNVVANFIGRGWTAIVLVAFVPLYIDLLGIEAYGLIGLFVSLQTLTSVLDLGLSTTLNREVTRLAAQPGREQETRDLVCTLEWIYWGAAGLIMLLAFGLAPLVAGYWITSQSLPEETVRRACFFMGVAVALRFPFALYSGGLLGLQRQVLFNALLVFTTALQWVGALVLLKVIPPTITSFFIWQVVASGLQTAASAFLLWRLLARAAGGAHFRKPLLSEIWHFAAGMAGISVFAIIVTQVDKVVLSRLLTLEAFGYYSLATLLASGLTLLAGPVFTAIFPRFSQLVVDGDTAGLVAFYHAGSQVAAVCVLPAAVVIALFSPEILYVWTGNAHIVESASTLVSVLTVGSALNALVFVPYALQLAYGWTRLALYQNIIIAILIVPALLWATSRFGAVGAAAVMAVRGAGEVLVGVSLMHSRLLRGERLRWYWQDIGLPLAGALVGTLALRFILPLPGSPSATAISLLAVSGVALAASILLTPFTRQWIGGVLLGRAPIRADRT
jgi:O-antigen/teichoic acid export membrane protein